MSVSATRRANLRFYAVLPIEEDPNYANGYHCDFCGKDFDQAPFFHCTRTGTDCCLTCAGSGSSSSRGTVSRAEYAKSLSKRHSASAAPQTAALAAASAKDDDQAVNVRVVRRICFPGVSSFTKAHKGALDAASSASSSESRPGPSVFPLLGYQIEQRVFGVVASTGITILVEPAADRAWMVQPAPAAGGDVLACVLAFGGSAKRKRETSSLAPTTSVANDVVTKLTIDEVESKFPWAAEAAGFRTWSAAARSLKSRDDISSDLTPMLPRQVARGKPPAAPSSGVPAYVRWASLTKEQDPRNPQCAIVGSGMGRLVFMLSTGTTQLVDFGIQQSVLVHPARQAPLSSLREPESMLEDLATMVKTMV